MSTIAETAETLSATPDTSTATLKDAYTINGCPVSFVYIEGFTHEYPSLMEEFHLPSVPVDPETDLPDFSNKDMLINSLNTIIKTPRLRTAFLEILSILQSDVYGAYRLDKAPILSLLEQYSRTNKPVVELGCGMGVSTAEWTQYLPNIIGAERQHHAKWYTPQWKPNGSNERFIRADFTNGLPFPNASVAGYILENVLAEVDKDGIHHLVCEAYRTLVPDGLLISGPHWDDEKGRMWRVFQKTDGGFTELAT